MGEKQPEPRTNQDDAETDERRRGLPATFTGDMRGEGATSGVDLGRGGTTTPARDQAGGGEPHDNAHLPAPPGDSPRTATEMAPGIPTGSGKGIDEALRQPDSDIGGGVAGHSTPAAEPRPDSEAEGRGRTSEDVRTDDRDRTTL